MIRFPMPTVLVALLLNSLAATAQDQRQETPGQFDFYALQQIAAGGIVRSLR
jgi:hypothetical protein